MTLTFDKASHSYTLDGRWVPNVTLVTDALSSYAGVPADVLKRKAAIGDAVHYATELYDANDLDWNSVPIEIEGYVKGWVKFKEDTGWITELSEQRVYSEKYQYAGTLDCVGRFTKLRRLKPRHTIILDKKTTYDYLPSFGPQIAGYLQAWNEHHTPKATHRVAVRLMPDGTYELYECDDPTDWSVYLSALSLRNWKHRHGIN